MIEASKRVYLCALIPLALASACSPGGEGEIPCVDDSSCPAEFPVCGANARCVAGASPASAQILGVAGKLAGDPVRATVTVQIAARSASGVRSVSLSGGGQTFSPAAGATGPVFDVAVDTTRLADGAVSLAATVTPGDTSVQPVTSAPFVLAVDNTAPVLTAGATIPPAQTGTLVTLDVIASEALRSIDADVLLSGDVVGKAAEVSSPTGNVHHLGFALVSSAVAGTYAFRATAVDLAGNATAAPLSKTFDVPPAPTATLLADATNISVGSSANLTATFADGTAAVSANPPDASLPGTVTTGQPFAVSPAVDTTYTLVVTNPAGATVSRTVTIFVGQAVTVSLTPPASANPGQAVNLIANVSANAQSAFVVPGNFPVTANGTNQNVSVSASVTTTFTLVATNGAGAEFRTSATLNVTQPVIVSFGGPAAVTTGSGVTLTAQFNPAGATASVTGCAGGAVTGAGPFQRSFTCPAIATPTTYTLDLTLGTAVVHASAAVQAVAIPTASLAASAAFVSKGNTITLTPTFTGGTSSFIADDSGVHVFDNPAQGVATSAITVNRSNTYTLVVTNAAGTSATDSVAVTALNTVEQTAGTTGARFGATATLLDDGRVLIAGGATTAGGNGTSSAVLYNPITRTFSSTGNLGTARRDHTAHPLSDGNVLVVGGFDGAGNPVNSLEVFDPAAGANGTFSAFTLSGGSGTGMTTARALHTGTILPNGTLLVAGGCDTALCATGTTTAEIITITGAATGTTAATGALNNAHVGGTGTLFDTGASKVLIAGGSTAKAGNGTDFAEVFSAGTFSCTGTSCGARTPMNKARAGHGALRLGNGQVALIGGKDAAGTALSSIELFDPTGNGGKGTFSANATPLSTARFQLQATQLAGAGRILVSGGFTTGTTGSTALDLFDVTGTTFTAVTPIDALTTARGGHTATLLFGGTALIAGGTATTTTGELFSSGQ